MGILNFYRNEYKKSKLPKLGIIKDSSIRKELELIVQKKSTLSSRERQAVIKHAIDYGIIKREKV